jgi:GNAT superfamily N-acetyltransferase
MAIHPTITIKSLELNLDLLKELELMIFEEHRVTEEKFDWVMQRHPLLLVAYDGKQPVGFKLGYAESESTFYSWLGGVHPEYRRQGIAQDLLTMQEDIMRKSGIKLISFRTYNRFPAMIELGKRNGYHLVKSEQCGDEQKYWYEKQFNSPFPKFD